MYQRWPLTRHRIESTAALAAYAARRAICPTEEADPDMPRDTLPGLIGQCEQIVRDAEAETICRPAPPLIF